MPTLDLGDNDDPSKIYFVIALFYGNLAIYSVSLLIWNIRSSTQHVALDEGKTSQSLFLSFVTIQTLRKYIISNQFRTISFKINCKFPNLSRNAWPA